MTTTAQLHDLSRQAHEAADEIVTNIHGAQFQRGFGCAKAEIEGLGEVSAVLRTASSRGRARYHECRRVTWYLDGKRIDFEDLAARIRNETPSRAG